VKLRLKPRQHDLGLAPVETIGVPVRHLRTKEHTDDDDRELDADRHPVLCVKLCHGTFEDHRRPPVNRMN